MTILIILLSMYAIIMTVIAYISHKRAVILSQRTQVLIAEKRKLSDALRKKGIEVAQLTKQIKRLEKNEKH